MLNYLKNTMQLLKYSQGFCWQCFWITGKQGHLVEVCNRSTFYFVSITQLAFTCSKSAIETLQKGKCVKYV